jgi:type II secretory pathway pseudopilin PulG
MRPALPTPFGWLVLVVMTEKDPSESPEEKPEQGSMRFQDPETTRPREPTVAEARARRDREKARQEAEQARLEAEKKAASRRKLLIGSGVTIGLVGVVAAGYLVGTPNEVSAVCTDDTGTVVQDNYCDDSYITSQHGYFNSGTGFWIIPLATGGFRQYRYNYGGTGLLGSHVAGGTYTAPSGNTTVKTKSGTTVQRGGFGVSGGTDGGKSGGS